MRQKDPGTSSAHWKPLYRCKRRANIVGASDIEKRRDRDRQFCRGHSAGPARGLTGAAGYMHACHK
jgi:hypothetical protein